MAAIGASAKGCTANTLALQVPLALISGYSASSVLQAVPSAQPVMLGDTQGATMTRFPGVPVPEMVTHSPP